MTFVTPYWSNNSLASTLWQELDQIYNDRSASPSAEVTETEKHFLLSMDLPGLKKEDIQIEVQDKLLTVSGERKREPRRNFKRSFTLPNSIHSEQIEARYEDGVLELYLPKIAAAQPRKVEIHTGKGGFFDKLLGGKTDQPEMKNVSGH
jgi:HSP20 family protein